uniref:Uncharacterized protein LOC103437416 n=1 Tax=Rhizophora mucronata TaxID=61149 RepID=A0A2P2LGD6_RHIMU
MYSTLPWIYKAASLYNTRKSSAFRYPLPSRPRFLGQKQISPVVATVYDNKIFIYHLLRCTKEIFMLTAGELITVFLSTQKICGFAMGDAGSLIVDHSVFLHPNYGGNAKCKRIKY